MPLSNCSAYFIPFFAETVTIASLSVAIPNESATKYHALCRILAPWVKPASGSNTEPSIVRLRLPLDIPTRSRTESAADARFLSTRRHHNDP